MINTDKYRPQRYELPTSDEPKIVKGRQNEIELNAIKQKSKNIFLKVLKITFVIVFMIMAVSLYIVFTNVSEVKEIYHNNSKPTYTPPPPSPKITKKLDKTTMKNFEENNKHNFNQMQDRQKDRMNRYMIEQEEKIKKYQKEQKERMDRYKSNQAKKIEEANKNRYKL